MRPKGSGAEVPADASVLVIEEDDELAQQYVDWLADRWDTSMVTGDSDALEALEADPDVVILRRTLSGIHGDRLLGMINERGIGARVAMITGVDPGPASIRLSFDDFLVDPVTEADLISTVEELLLRGVYEDRVAEFYALASRKAKLEGESPAGRLLDTDEHQKLRRELREARAAVDDVLLEFHEHDAYTRLCDELSRRPPTNNVDNSVPEP